MADSKISALTAVVTPAGTDELAVNQAGVSKKLTVTQLLSLAGSSDPSLLGNGSAGAPSYSFSADPDTGMYGNGSGALFYSINGTATWLMTASYFSHAVTGNTPRLLAVNSTATSPNVLSRNDDSDTGLGANSDDQMSLIAGGVEAVRYSEVSSHVLKLSEAQTGITASATQTQGQQPLTSSYNEISTIVSGTDVVTLPTAVAGQHCTVVNSSANILQIFPASGDDLGKGVNASTVIAGGGSITFWCHDATTWSRLSAGDLGSLSNVDSALPVDNTMLVYNSSATEWEANAGVKFDETLMSVAGTVRTTTGLAQLGNTLATATVPTLQPHSSDSDTGIGKAATDGLSLIAGGVEAMRFQETGTTVLLTQQSEMDLSASTGGAQGGSPMGSSLTRIYSASTAGDSCTLPAAAPIGTRVLVMNDGGANIAVFPASGDTINGLAINAAYTLLNTQSAEFVQTGVNEWQRLIHAT